MDHSNIQSEDSMDFTDVVQTMEQIEDEPSPSVSVPLEDGEVPESMDLNVFAKKLAEELYRVKSIVHLVSIEEIGARIEECKVAMSMYNKLFEMLVTEHTKRCNVSSSIFSKDGEICDKPE